jgi:hypothetical protein
MTAPAHPYDRRRAQFRAVRFLGSASVVTIQWRPAWIAGQTPSLLTHASSATSTCSIHVSASVASWATSRYKSGRRRASQHQHSTRLSAPARLHLHPRSPPPPKSRCSSSRPPRSSPSSSSPSSASSPPGPSRPSGRPTRRSTFPPRSSRCSRRSRSPSPRRCSPLVCRCSPN